MFPINSVLLGLVVLFSMVKLSYAEVAFSDTFDTQPDWQSYNNTAGATYQCNIPGQLCNPLPPSTWSYYRATGMWEAPSGQDTVRIGNQAGRGGVGKAFIVNNESNNGSSGDGWGADGQLVKVLGQEYPELFVRAWVYYQPGFQAALTNDMMIKTLRVFHYTGSGDIFSFFGSGNSAPIYLYLFKHSNSYGTRAMLDYRCEPKATNYYCSGGAYDHDTYFLPGQGSTPTVSSPQEPADGSWHSIELHVKMNTSSGGVFNSDGVGDIWFDGNLIDHQSNLRWLDTGSDPTTGWNSISLGGNAYNLFSDPANKAEQWYAIDDLVVSTTYSGPPPQPVSVSALGVSDTSINVAFQPGTNGATYPLDGYRIYYGTDASNLSSSVSVAAPATNATISTLATGTRYYFAVTAYNKGATDVNENESLRSSTVDAVTVDTTPPVVTLAPVTPVTKLTSQNLSGTVSDAGGIASVTVTIGAGAAQPATVVGNTWTCSATGMVAGANAVTVTAKDLSNNPATATGSIFVDLTPPDLTIAAVTSPTKVGSQSISGTVDDSKGVSSVKVTVGSAAAADAVVSGTAWSYTVPALAEGANAISVTATDVAGNTTAKSTSITLDTAAPTLVIAPVTTPTLLSTQTISGTVSDTGGVAGLWIKVGDGIDHPVTVTAGAWSYPVTGLLAEPNPANLITVTARDTAGNQSIASASINRLLAGDLNGDGVVGVDDALVAMEAAVGLRSATAAQLQRGDLAPMHLGLPAPDGVIDTGDAVVILGIVVGINSY